MKVIIKPYPEWYGPAQFLRTLRVPDTLHEKIMDWLVERAPKFIDWIEERYENKTKNRVKLIRIDDYDVWNVDHTLALIIVPMLKKLKEKKHGSPNVDDKDVPMGIGLRSTEAPPKENAWDTDEFWHKRWEWVLDEMIWAFEYTLSDIRWLQTDTKILEKEEARADNGRRLFAKYYHALWD